MKVDLQAQGTFCQGSQQSSIKSLGALLSTCLLRTGHTHLYTCICLARSSLARLHGLIVEPHNRFLQTSGRSHSTSGPQPSFRTLHWYVSSFSSGLLSCFPCLTNEHIQKPGSDGVRLHSHCVQYIHPFGSSSKCILVRASV